MFLVQASAYSCKCPELVWFCVDDDDDDFVVVVVVVVVVGGGGNSTMK